MSCNGCRVLRKGCNDACVLRPCLQWIDSAAAQGHATLFVAKFFGRAGLLSFISAAPDHQRPALFQSLLSEACGRTINPIGGAVGLLSTGNWHLCQAAVDAVLRGDALRPLPGLPQAAISPLATLSDGTGGRNDLNLYLFRRDTADRREAGRPATPSIQSDGSVTTTSGESLTGDDRTLLDLFV